MVSLANTVYNREICGDPYQTQGWHIRIEFCGSPYQVALDLRLESRNRFLFGNGVIKHKKWQV